MKQIAAAVVQSIPAPGDLSRAVSDHARLAVQAAHRGARLAVFPELSLTGYDLGLTRAVADAVPVPVIASGGVGSLDHLVAGIRDGHAAAVLAASIFHFGTHSVAEAKRHMAARGLNIRPA